MSVNERAPFEDAIRNGDYTHRMKVSQTVFREALEKPDRFEGEVIDWKRGVCATGFLEVRTVMEAQLPGFYLFSAAFSKPAPIFQMAASAPLVWLFLVGNAQRYHDAGKSYWPRLMIFPVLGGLWAVGLIKPEPYLMIGIDENLPQRVVGPAVMVISYILFWIAMASVVAEALLSPSKIPAVAGPGQP